jgi:uroporphyrinogen decarboxylase
MFDPKVLSRIEASLNFTQPDRLPVCEFIDNPKVFEYCCYDEDPHLEYKVKAYHKLGIDICWRFDRRQTEREKGWLEKLQKFALRKPKINYLNKEDLEQEFSEFKSQQMMFAPLTYLAMTADGCLSSAYKTLGFEEFCKKMYTELIEIEKLIDICAENLRQRAELFAEEQLGPVFFIRDDIAYKKGLLFSKNFLDQIWLPKIQNAIYSLKQKNIKVVLHSQGNITGYLDELIEAGFDGIHPVDISSGMDIGIIKKKYSKSLVLFGNVDLINTDPSGTKDIAARTKKCIDSASYDGGHFIGTSHGINKDLLLQDVLAFFANIKEFGTFSQQ